MRLGILGGGQLGRMLALAGYPLGLRFRFWDPSPAAPARLLGEHLVADYLTGEALEEFCRGLDGVTLEFENVPLELVQRIEERVPTFPSSRSLEVAQDRLSEKRFFRELGIPTGPFHAVDREEDLAPAGELVGFPAVLKTRRLGYDGKGQIVVGSPLELEIAWRKFSGRELLLEGWVGFRRELSLLAVRYSDGTVCFYPPVENHHREGILRRSIAPAPDLSAALEDRARGLTGRVLEALKYVGVLALEFFEVEGELLANEMACRVHNSGHWSIEGASHSQFESHLRAGLGLPPGETDVSRYCAMVNLIGGIPDLEKILRVPGTHLHLYDKEPAPSRKIGHITGIVSTVRGRETWLKRVTEMVEGRPVDS